MAHAGQVLFLLGGVPGTIPAGLGKAVHRGDEEAPVHQVLEHGRVEHGCAAGQHTQAVQTLPFALHHIMINALQQHRHHRHHVTPHGPQVPVEIFQVVAQVHAVAGDAPGHQAGHGRNVEHGQAGQRAERVGVPAGLAPHVLKGGQEGRHGGEQVLLGQHNALAAASGAGGEHDKSHCIEVRHLGDLHGRLKGGKGVHRHQTVPVRLAQGRLPAQVLAVMEHAHRLHQIQLVADLVPVLAGVQGHCHSSGQHCAVHAHHIVVAVAGQDGHSLPQGVRGAAAQKCHEPPQVCSVLPEGHLHHAALGLIIIADTNPVCVDRFQIVQRLIQRMNHVSLHVTVFYIPAAGPTRGRAAFSIVFSIQYRHWQCNTFARFNFHFWQLNLAHLVFSIRQPVPPAQKFGPSAGLFYR